MLFVGDTLCRCHLNVFFWIIVFLLFAIVVYSFSGQMHFHFVTSHERRAKSNAIRSVRGVTIRWFSSNHKMLLLEFTFQIIMILMWCDALSWFAHCIHYFPKLNRSRGIETAQRWPPNISCIFFIYLFVVFMNPWWPRQIHCNHFMQQIDCIDHSTNLTIWFCIFQRKQHINLFIPEN